MTINDRERLKKLLIENSIFFGKFKLVSGLESDYYIDARRTTLHPLGSYLIGKIFLTEIYKDEKVVAVGGPTLGADPIIGSILSMSANNSRPLNGFIVRKREKGYGIKKLIEGNVKAGDRVAIVEDVVTTGGSVLKAIREVEDIEATVSKILFVVDREEGAKAKIESMGYSYYSIFNVSELIGNHC